MFKSEQIIIGLGNILSSLYLTGEVSLLEVIELIIPKLKICNLIL